MNTPAIRERKTKRTPTRERFADCLAAYVAMGLPPERIGYDRRNDVVFVIPENEPYTPSLNGVGNEWEKAHGRGL